MTRGHLPALILGIAVGLYWACVVAMVIQVSRKGTGARRVLVPARWTERLMWVVWIPVVLGWILLPLVAATVPSGSRGWMALPGVATASALVLGLRWLAAGLALVCLSLSIWCWRHMGRHWRMAIDPRGESRLLQDGPFALVRHPIYALSMALMLCTVIAVPTPTMLILALIHIALMQLKARSEEAFLLARHGALYADYCARVGRFIPRARPTAAREPQSGPAGEPAPPPAGLAAARACAVPRTVRLSFFQQAMLLWDRVHPYNAAHAVRLPGSADPEALRSAARQVCEESGIGELVVHRWRGTYGYRPLRAVPVTEFPPSTQPTRLLCRVVADALNTPFDRGPHHPIRWIVFDEADGAAHYVILVYHHVVSDAHGIELLLGAILRRYLRVDPTHADAPLETAAPRCAAWMNGALRRHGYRRTLRRLWDQDLAWRCAHKMPDERGAGDLTELAVRTAPAELFPRLSAACRQHGVGMNDLFTAALAAAIAERTADRHTSRRRRKIALGGILNLRSASPEDVSRYFGVCLADMVLLLDRPDANLDELIAQVAAQTRPQKADLPATAALSALRTFVIRRVWPALFVPNRRRSYRRLFPICAGVSTVFIDEARVGAATRSISRYIRAGPPGPAMPMVLAPTILHGRLELSLVHRTSCMPPERAEDLLDSILARLKEWADRHPATGGAAGTSVGLQSNGAGR